MKEKKTLWIIHQYASTPDTGMGGRHFYLAEELAKLGHKVYVVAASANHLLHTQPHLTSKFTFEKISGFTFVWVKMPPYAEAHSKQRALNWFLFPWRIQKLTQVIVDKPDAVLCSSPSPIAFLGAERLAKKLKAKLIFEVRDIWPLTLTEIGGYSPKHPFIRLMGWVERRAYKNADLVVSNLKNAVEHMVTQGLRREKFVWIPNGFSLTEVSQKTPLNKQATNQLPKNKFIVGYTGTIGVANALDSLIEAAAILRKNKDIAFVLVGHGKEKTTLQALVENKQLKNVYFIDSIPKIEIQAMLAEFSVCYMGLTKDPLFRFGVSPNKLFDYLYSGKPVLYAVDSGNYTPIKDSKAGMQIEPQNPQAIADAVLKFYNMTPKERTKMGENGCKVAMQQYEYGKLAKKLEKLLF
ncbi:MAG: glycosyltransferase family 4 protein [Flavobacteriales bacterium]|nr:glycosyltransferase family 4 protein [Flavobacteriales bacterium]